MNDEDKKDKGKWDIRKERKQEQIMMQRLSRSQIWIETQDIKTKALSDNLRFLGVNLLNHGDVSYDQR